MPRGRHAEPSNVSIEERNALVLANIPFVRSHIREKWHSLVNTEYHQDAISEGIVGMIRAAELYDPSKETTFITYAVHWIDNHVRRYADKIRSPVYMSATRIMLRKHLTKSYRGVWGNSDTKLKDLIPEGREVKPGTLRSLLVARVSRTNIFQDWPDREPNAEEALCHHHALRVTERVMELLDDRSRRMVSMRHGDWGEEKTLEEVAAPWNLTRERARQILDQAYRKIRRTVPRAVQREILELFTDSENLPREEWWMPVEGFEDHPDRYFAVPRYDSRFDCPCCGSRISSPRAWQFECPDCGYDSEACPPCHCCEETAIVGFPCYCDFSTPRQEGTLEWHIHRILLLVGGCPLDRLMHELEEAGFSRRVREVEGRLYRDGAVLKGADDNYYLLENAPERLIELARVEKRLKKLERDFEARSEFLLAQVKVTRKAPERVAALRQELLVLEEGYLEEKERLLQRWEEASKTNVANIVKD